MAKRSARSCLPIAALASLLALPASMPASAVGADAALQGSFIGLLNGPGMPDAATDLYLEVTLNGVSTGRVLQVAVDARGHHHAWPPNLQDAGIRTDGLPPDRYVDLATVPGLGYSIDMPNQLLEFMAAVDRLDRDTQQLNGRPQPRYAATAADGALLNYDLYGIAGDDGSRALSAFTELRAFGGWGLLSSTGLSGFGDSGTADHYTRLDTTWVRSFQDELVTLRLGDVVSGSLSWSRPTRLGGLQWRRDFGLQPQMVTFPLPAFFGQAALPSSVELYVNGIQQYAGSVAPGSFLLTTVPGINGAGQAQVVLTDALGRRSVISFPYYNASQLLKPGFSDWSLEVGAVRQGYGLESFDYRSQPAASGSLRYGLNDWLTLESHGEASVGLGLGGVGAVLRLGRSGVLSGAYARAAGDSDGGQSSLGYSWVVGRFYFDLGSQQRDAGYRDIASADSRDLPRRSQRAVAGVALGGRASFSLSYNRLDTEEDGRQRYAGAGYSLNLPYGIGVFASYTRALDGERDSTLFAGLSCSFGNRVHAGLTLQRQGGRDTLGADLVSSLPLDGGVGWSLRSQQGQGIESYQAEAAWRGDLGQLNAGVNAIDGHDSAFAGYSGGVVLMDGSLFPGRRIDEGFALVTTHGVPDVPVLLENRPIGRTDRSGHYLLTGLNAWQPNDITVDAVGLPAGLQVGATEHRVVPVAQAGVRADFDIRPLRALLLTLVDGQGAPLPLGSTVHVSGRPDQTGVVGYDGQAYVENPPTQATVAVRLPDRRVCEVRIELPANASGITSLGPLACR